MILRHKFQYKLRMQGHSIVFQEVPDEVSLALSISGCQYKCPDCHSKYLWNEIGENVMKKLPALLNKYGQSITCVCFMGGNQRPEELRRLVAYCRGLGYKTCLYTGAGSPSDLRTSLIEQLDYLKTGPFIKEFGPLTSPRTNQRFYKVVHNPRGAIILEDKTNLFWKEHLR